MLFLNTLVAQILDVILLRPFKGYRTLALNILAVIAGLSDIAGFTAIVTGPYGIWFMIAVAVANAILRWDTDTKVLSKE